MADFEYVNQQWDRQRVLDLVEAWYELRCDAVDRGDPVGVLDCVQLERGVSSVADPVVRAALWLRMAGWDVAEIGSVLRDPKRNRPGESLVREGVRRIALFEELRKHAPARVDAWGRG